MASSKPLIVAAIDFGTTFSGWAYSFIHEFKSDPSNATVRCWNAGTSTLVTEKTPTCALISPDGKKLIKFGYEAENRYEELAAKKEHKDYYYFKRFKMTLNKATISRNFMIEDELGKIFPAINLFSMSIAFLVDDMLETGGKAIMDGLCKTDVQWVITVPAIWSDAAKQFMREAATREPANIDTKKLLIALEPEAASIFCRNLSVVHEKSNDTVSNLPTGSKYMILDAGGGTIDITVHEVSQIGGLKEIYAASGGGWGGILVDEAFQDMLKDLVSKQVYKKFVKQETEDWLDLWRTFEVKKKTIDPSNDSKVTMKLPLSLMDLYKAETGRDLKDGIAESTYGSQINLSGDKFRCNSRFFQGLFNNSIKKTVAHVKSVLQNAATKDTQAILMVGGFSDSPVLQKAIKGEFSHMKIIIPKEASSAILRGAVIFGHNPTSISQRVLKKTYGIETHSIFDENVHDQKYKTETDKGTRCDKTFHKHVEKGQPVEINKKQAGRSYTPAYHGLTELLVPVYASNLMNPMYTDQGCEYLGKLTVDLSDVPGDLDREIFVDLAFGDTEIKATGRVEATGQEVSASFDFLG